MRLAFVNPSVGFSDRRKSKPIGLAYIMAYLRSHGYTSDGYDFGDAQEDPRALAERYGLDRYNCVGFSVYNESFLPAVAMATWIKQRNPDAIVVMGGPHATAVHEHIVRTHPCVDVVVRREGEEPMLELMRAWGDLERMRTVTGTTWRDASDIRVNPDRGFIMDLDVLPFPDAEFQSHSGYPALTYFDEVLGTLKHALTINSSRSCPYNCSFCGVLTIGRKYRSRSAESIVQELDYFRNKDGLDYKHVYFSDANFFVFPKQCAEIAAALYAFDSEISFSFGTRVNQILRAKALLPELKRCGLRFIELGVESASEPVLQRLAKEVEPTTNVAAIKLLQRLDIEISLDFIMLDPASTLVDVQANLTFLRGQGFYDYVPHDHLYSTLILYEGTPIRSFYERRLGLQFDPDVLPDHFSLYEDLAIQRVSDVLQWFREQWQPQIDEALARLELALETGRRRRELLEWSDEEFARCELDAVSLRHAPNLYFESLVTDAASGFPTVNDAGPEGLLPKLSYDRVSLSTLLARSIAAVQKVSLDDRLVAVGTLGRFR